MSSQTPPSLPVRQLTQTNFKANPKFNASRLNLHQHPERSRDRVVVFVHGLGGRGYKTWKHWPGMLFDAPAPRGVDVAVFDYRSGQRKLLGAQPGEQVHLLVGRLRDLATCYGEIHIVGHSLGGLIAAEAVREFVQESGRRGRT